MNMRGDNLVKRRGKTKQFRGPIQGQSTSADSYLYDFSWSTGKRPTVLYIPEGYYKEIKGQWTYPKKGFIQWKIQT